MPPSLTAAGLDAFVAESDRRGGPGATACEAYWQGFSYAPAVTADQSLDPFSEAYVKQQLALHRELSGKGFDQARNELVPFALLDHVSAINPYNHPDPSVLALHVQRLSKAFRLTGAKRDAHLLDMGCGWGLSSEAAAYLGLQVTAVDISESFVALVNARAARSGWPIQAVQSSFDDYRPVVEHDVILFYECFHHAVRPWTLLETMARNLSVPDGRLSLAGEPVNDIWWKNWGLRLDALSVYCMRKFGWFESGWSLPFLHEMFDRAGLDLHVHADPDGEIGYTLIGTLRRGVRQPMTEILPQGRSEGLHIEGGAAWMADRARLEVPFPDGTGRAWLEITNSRGRPVRVAISQGGTTLIEGLLKTGVTRLPIQPGDGIPEIILEAETWRPSAELGVNDDRLLSLHLSAVVFD